MSDNIHVSDIGTIFKLLIVDDDTGEPIDLLLAQTKTIIFRKPDGTTVTKTAEFTTDGSDGYIDYTTVENDLDIAGNWNIQGFVSSNAYENHSEIEKFKVRKNLITV